MSRPDPHTARTAVKIWQIDTAGDPHGVDGVAHVVWPVCERLAAAGHEVTIFVRSELTEEAAARADDAGIRIVEAFHARLGVNIAPLIGEMRRSRPDVVQVHVPLIPQCAAAVRLCRLTGVRWIYTTHGGLAPEILEYPPTKSQRRIYLAMLERSMIRDAAAIVYCSEAERFDARAVSSPRGLELVVEPPVDPSCFAEPPWSLPTGDPVAVYLGRFDVYQKAIDRLVALFGLLPDVQLRAVGEAAPADAVAMAEIMGRATSNISFESPVRGEGKLELLRSATLYVQLSRFEGFPVSVAEALTVGTPTAVARTLGIASTIRGAGAGLCLDADLRRSASQIRGLLANPRELERLSAAGRSFAAEHFTIDAVASKYLELFAQLDRLKTP